MTDLYGPKWLSERESSQQKLAQDILRVGNPPKIMAFKREECETIAG